MQSQNELRNLLQRIDHKSYPAYKDTRGSYDFGNYVLSIDHVQGSVCRTVEGERPCQGNGSEVPGGSLPDEMPQAGSVRLSAASVWAGT